MAGYPERIIPQLSWNFIHKHLKFNSACLELEGQMFRNDNLEFIIFVDCDVF